MTQNRDSYYLIEQVEYDLFKNSLTKNINFFHDTCHFKSALVNTKLIIQTANFTACMEVDTPW